jgi:hypothetical protein
MQPPRYLLVVFALGVTLLSCAADEQRAASPADTQPSSASTQSSSGQSGIRITPGDGNVLNVTIDGEPFTAFHFSEQEPKPYLYPLLAPGGVPVTRDYPMKDTDADRRAKAQDHPHQRSLWTAHGDVRTRDFTKPGTDYWAQGTGKGLQKVRRIVSATSGPTSGQIVAEVDWVTADGRRELSDTRTYTFLRGDANMRMIDVQIVLHFPDGDALFGDTKEGGMVALRVAPWIAEKGGGHMVNARGDKGMAACWGRPANWCDYVGRKDGQAFGIAVFDGPENFRHPERWHIRDYGLYTANPFCLAAFTGDKSADGSQRFKKGENATFRYRVIVHRGDATAAGIAEQYRAFAGKRGRPNPERE